MERKSKTLDLFGDKYKIKYVDGVIKLKDNDEDSLYWGITYHSGKEIQVSTRNYEDKELSDDTIRITLLHEIFHAIFVSGQYHKENENEALVEWCAKCVNQALKQKII